MNLSFVIMGTFAILTAFGVFQGAIKNIGLNRLFVALFFLVGAILSLFNNINIYGIEISLNSFNFTLAFLLLLPKLRTVKSFLSMLICLLLTITILVCYNAFDLTNFEYDFVQPYVYVSICVGIIFSVFIKNVSSVFCGTFLGTLVFEIVTANMFNMQVDNIIYIGSEMMIVSILIVTLTYSLLYYIKSIFTILRLKKKSKPLN